MGENSSIAVALTKQDSYDTLMVEQMEKLMKACGLPMVCGERVLVKPNLLCATELACTKPQVVAAVCQVLLDHGVKVVVADSPGFGRAEGVAQKIGLSRALAPLKITVQSLEKVQWVSVQALKLKLPIAQMALRMDRILSLPKVKAHCQVGLSLSVKNCFGCMPGLHKAILHGVHGSDPCFFADCIVELVQKLPPICAVCDGICAMHITGPRNGAEYPLGLLGASQEAWALDEAVARILGQNPEKLLFGAAQRRHGMVGDIWFPLDKPEAFSGSDFVVPNILLSTSFSPYRLIVSLFRRLWAARKF